MRKIKTFNVTLGGHDITATSTVDQGFVEGVKVSGDKMLWLMLQAPPSQLKVKVPMSELQWSLIQLAMLLLMAVTLLQKWKSSATGISLEATTGNNLTLNGTTINAQGNKSSSNGSTAIFAQKGNLLQGFDGDATDNITLADSNIINGGIETIVIAKENKEFIQSTWILRMAQ